MRGTGSYKIDTNKAREFSLSALDRYWAGGCDIIRKLPVPVVAPVHGEPAPPVIRSVILPEWAQDIGVDGLILVPSGYVDTRDGEEWARVDWHGVVFLFLNGLAERTFEDQSGSIHSYSYRLKGWDSRLWERAWVNRIALFLRRWAAVSAQVGEEILFAPLPQAEIVMTHDVDAIYKTIPLRLKQSAFNGFNLFRNILDRRYVAAYARLLSVFRFLFSKEDYWFFEKIMESEERSSIRSVFFIYGGGVRQGKTFKQIVFDPSYSLEDPKVRRIIFKILSSGWQVGLHQSFEAWKDYVDMGREKKYLEDISGQSALWCRQHWLRFSWKHTWKAQKNAGFQVDATLGFNDRPGFRNGAALRFSPWDFEEGCTLDFLSLPMILMDSHLYDYEEMNDGERIRRMDYWISEVKKTRGIATIIWHQQVFGSDYGWQGGFEKILEQISSKGGVV
jgi:hypothetical protein